MKFIDKFLKKLHTSRNTFATYILTLITIYIVVDRLVEVLFMAFTGVSVAYWGPIKYTLALACCVFAYLFSPTSEFGKSKNARVTLFFIYSIGLYIIAVSMFTQWLNQLAWILFLSVPNYVEIVTEFSNLVRPAFIALSIYIPLLSIRFIIKKLVLGLDDTEEEKRSLWDYRGISLAKGDDGRGPYSYELYLFNDRESGKPVKLKESRRYQAMLVVGASGTGKTTLMYEPMIARDIEKKFFFREVSKEMGFTALKTGVATLKSPYDNDYLNENFSLGMLEPKEGKEKLYKAYMKKLLLSDSDELISKDLGLTCMSPDYEIIEHMTDVCDNFKIKYNIIDPSSNTSIGLNPFVYNDPAKIAITISSVLKGMYLSKNVEKEDAYSEDVTLQAIENITILLKEIYPRMHEGTLPNLEDMLKLLINFDLVEKMCKIMEANDKLAEKYEIQLEYFKRNFFKDGLSRKDTERAIYASVAQLDNLLRMPGVKKVLCNRTNNIDFDKMLANGEVTFICTRRGDLGVNCHKAFGLFFLLSMQNSVLSRPGFENTRIPHFLYIDEFPDFIGKATEPLFTMYRKYKVGVIVSSQSLAQLGKEKTRNRDTIIANCRNKILTGGTTPDEAQVWHVIFNRRRHWNYQRDLGVNEGGQISYDPKYKNIKYDWENYFAVGKLMALPFKHCAYQIATDGRDEWGEGLLNFLDSKYKEPQSIKKYNFEGFINNSKGRKEVKHSDEIIIDDEGPVKTDITDSRYFFDNEDAISIKLDKKP